MYIDGFGILFGDIFVGDLDMVMYEKIEFICGFNGLIIGLGNLLGMVNYVCKCLGNEKQVSVLLIVGCWNNFCVVVDVLMLLIELGSWVV